MKKTKKDVKIPLDRDPLHPERKLVTRRDFLASGALGFSGTVMLPSLLQTVLFERAVRAGVIDGANPTPFIIFDCAGGAALPGNWMPLNQAGTPLSSYSTLGLGGPGNGYVIDTSFGIPMAAPFLPVAPAMTTASTIFSKVYDSLQSQLSTSILGAINPATVNTPTTSPRFPNALLQMGAIPLNSMSDSQSNTLSPISLISAAGLTGKMVKSGMGMTAAQSGGNSDWGSANPQYKPLQIQSVTALSSALSYGNTLKQLGTNALNTVADTLISLSQSQAAQFSTRTLGSQLSSLFQSSYTANKGYVNGVTGIDPTQDQDAMAAYGLTAMSSPSDSTTVQATLVLNAVMGNSGPVVLTIGGCDYHTGTQTDGDSKDAEIGTAIARAMNLAYAKGTKVAFCVYTDGGIYSDSGARTWRGDDNLHGLAVFGVMDPAGQPAMAKKQVGYYSETDSAQFCDTSVPVSNDALKACHALFMNYLAVTGQMANYSTIIAQQDPRNTTLMSSLYGGSLSAMANDLLLFPNSTG